jgi:hypothetical protein
LADWKGDIDEGLCFRYDGNCVLVDASQGEIFLIKLCVGLDTEPRSEEISVEGISMLDPFWNDNLGLFIGFGRIYTFEVILEARTGVFGGTEKEGPGQIERFLIGLDKHYQHFHVS